MGSPSIDMGESEVGGWMLPSLRVKSTSDGGVDVVSVFHGCVKERGRSSDCGMKMGFDCGRGMPISTRSRTEGQTSLSLDFICQTEINVMSVLHVENTSV